MYLTALPLSISLSISLSLPLSLSFPLFLPETRNEFCNFAADLAKFHLRTPENLKEAQKAAEIAFLFSPQ
jgi:hypothetical protein